MELAMIAESAEKKAIVLTNMGLQDEIVTSGAKIGSIKSC